MQFWQAFREYFWRLANYAGTLNHWVQKLHLSCSFWDIKTLFMWLTESYYNLHQLLPLSSHYYTGLICKLAHLQLYSTIYFIRTSRPILTSLLVNESLMEMLKHNYSSLMAINYTLSESKIVLLVHIIIFDYWLYCVKFLCSIFRCICFLNYFMITH
jgi:hypothetical protein